jgi:hypothetical protein
MGLKINVPLLNVVDISVHIRYSLLTVMAFVCHLLFDKACSFLIVELHIFWID